jgi:hypothetical protein
MKSFTLLLFILFTTAHCDAQQRDVSDLPTGKYETRFKNNQAKWPGGDIFLSDGGQYKLSGASEQGEYRFSAAAQRVFFTAGPLKGMYASTALYNNSPVIIFPTTESQPVKLEGEVWAYYKN